MEAHSDSDVLLELKGYRLTTAEIIYVLPDFPDLLQTFIWQNLDIAPQFPRLHLFLAFWEQNIQAKLFSVRVAQKEDLCIADTRLAKEEFIL